MTNEVKKFWATDYETEYANGRRGQVLVVPASDYDALLAERDATQKDADRLAWLIDNGVQVTSVGGDPIRLTREVIDAALQES